MDGAPRGVNAWMALGSAMLCVACVGPSRHAPRVPDPPASERPTPVAHDVATARLRTCAVRADGATLCWGLTPWYASDGQLAPGAVAPFPRVIANASPSRQVVVGDGLSCAMLRDGRARCWSDAGGWGPAAPVVPDLRYSVVDAFGWTACGVSGGTVRCWGRVEDAVAPPARFLAEAVPVPGPVETLTLGGEPDASMCATTRGGESYVWHEPRHGAPRTSALRVPECPVAATVDVDTRNPPNTVGRLDCWLRGTSVYCNGETGCGSLVDLTPILRRSPDTSRCDRLVRGRPAVVLEDVASLAIGARHACALDYDGQLWCWGSNVAGQLGDGTFADSDVPVRPRL